MESELVAPNRGRDTYWVKHGRLFLVNHLITV